MATLRKLHVSPGFKAKRVFLPSISVKITQRSRSSSLQTQNPTKRHPMRFSLPGLVEDSQGFESRGSQRSKSFQQPTQQDTTFTRRTGATGTLRDNRPLKKSRSALTLTMNTLTLTMDAADVTEPQQRRHAPATSLKRFHRSASTKYLAQTQSRRNLGKRLLAKAQKTIQEQDIAEQVQGLVQLSLQGRLRLPHVLYGHTQTVVLAVLAHDDMHANPGWFQKYVNSTDDAGNTAIHVAAFNNDIVVACQLLQANPLLNVLNNRRATPLDLALFAGHTQMLKLLLKQGAILGPLLYENYSYLTDNVDASTRQLLRSYKQPMINFAEFATSSIEAPAHLYERPPPFASEQADTAEQDYTDVLSNDLSARSTPRRPSRSGGMTRVMTDADFFSAGVDL